MPLSMPRLRVLGIDPGFGRTGLGVIDLEHGEPAHVWHSVIETPPDQPFAHRLAAVRNDVTECVRRFGPSAACVEALFFQTNAKTAMKVGMARGVILLALADLDIPVIEVTPNQVKHGIAGWGGADKEQVGGMVVRLLKLTRPPTSDDAADALALAIVGAYVHLQPRA
jgi:crossover junction endodeoxyribonuclease RuvC